MTEDPDAVREILVIQVSRIGDTLLATPAMRAIAAAYPAARITCLAHPKRMEVLAGLPFIFRLGSITKRRAPFLGRFSGRRYDLAFVFGFDRPLVTFALRVARRVVAFRQGDESIDKRLWLAVDEPSFQSCHAVEYLLTLTDAASLSRMGLRLSYQVREAERNWAAAELAPLRIRGVRPLVGLQVASFPTKSYRDWPIGHFVDLCQQIRHEYPAVHFLIFGGSLERERTQALHAAMPHCSTHYAGRLTLRQTGALMNELDFYVGVDTGPTHIMGALHRPMVAMYHGYSPSRLLAPLEHPCLWPIDHPHAGEPGTPDDFPMADIPVDTVMAAVRRALGA